MTQRAVHLLTALGVAVIFSASLLSCRHQRVELPPRSVQMREGPPELSVCVAEELDQCTVRCDGPVRVYSGTQQVVYWADLPEREQVGRYLFHCRPATSEQVAARAAEHIHTGGYDPWDFWASRARRF